MAAAAARWDKWESLLDLVNERLVQLLSSQPDFSDVCRRSGGTLKFERNPSDEDWEYTQWKGWIDSTLESEKFTVCCHLDVTSESAVSVGTEIRVLGWDESRFRSVLPEIELHPSDYGVYCVLPLPLVFFEQAKLDDQAGIVAQATLDELVLPLVQAIKRARTQRK
ncbi:MAG: hypothetical protein IT294_00425 [Deltaproteobacteria bacterium]|nr:hypothetical protein [Deltaproteobacteria bacterium]